MTSDPFVEDQGFVEIRRNVEAALGRRCENLFAPKLSGRTTEPVRDQSGRAQAAPSQ